MVYFLGVLMGYLIGVNTIVEKQITKNFGEMYVNQTIGFLSSIGGLSRSQALAHRYLHKITKT